jgi:hypothetical protein
MDFDGAMPDPDAGNAPVLEYPEDGTVLPSNLPPIEAQWVAGGDSNVFRVRLSSPDVLQIDLYTPAVELLFEPGLWGKITASAPDAPITLAYASERPYGHRLTAANSNCSLVQGQKQCKQLWITAIDLAKLAAGSADPSMPSFWIPGQSIQAQYVSPQWTKAVLPPPN